LTRAGASGRDRARLPGALLLERALGPAQPPATTLSARQLRRQLIAALLAVSLILQAIGLGSLLEDLARELLVVAVGVLRGIGVHLGPINRDDLSLHQTSPRAQPEDLTEQSRQRVLMALAKRAIVQ
jgi:hypothetical protein